MTQQFPATIPSADGREFYVFDSNGHHASTIDAHIGLVKYAFRYDAAGYLTGISDHSTGLVTTIERDGSEVPLSITAPFGQKTTLSVVATQLKSVTDPESGLYKFDYFSGGLLQHFSDPPINAAGATPYSFAFTNELLSTDTDPLGNSQTLTSSLLTNGWRVTRKDQLLRPTTYDTQTPDPLSMLSTVTGPESLATTTSVFLDGRKADVAPDGSLFSGHRRNPDGSTVYSQIDSDQTRGMRAPVVSSSIEFMGTATDPHKVTTRSRSTQLIDPSNIASVLNSTETQTVNGRAHPDTVFYDVNSMRVTTTSSAGRSTYRFMDSHGRTTSFQVGTLTPTGFSYDDTGTATGKVSIEDRNDGTIDLKKTYTYFGTGNDKMSGYLSGVAYAQNSVVRQSSSYNTDAFGRTKLSTTGVDSTSFSWDGNGNLTSVTPPGRLEHDQTYTLLDQLLSYTPPALPAATPPTPVTTGYTYTFDRKPETVTTPDGVLTRQTYDAASGRLTDITTPAGVSHFDYYAPTDTAAGQAPGQLKTISSPYGANLAFTYLGRLTTSTTWSGSVNGSVAWVYDNDFAHISETVTDSVGTSAAIKFGYADLDKFLTCASLTNCLPPSTDALLVTHDSVNGLLTNVNFGALTESYDYDNFGQLASKIAKLGTVPLLRNVYDPKTGTTNRRDALGRITHREEIISAGALVKFDYAYSAEGRLTDVLMNGAHSEHYDYGTNGNRVAGNTPQRNVIASQVQYDSAAPAVPGQDRLTKYGQYTYTYTNNGELKTKTDTTATPNLVTTYAYDALANLISVSQPNRFIGYVIDGMNRRVAKKVGTTAANAVLVKQWLYRDSLKPVAELDGSGHLVSTFVYGSNANVPDYMVRGGKTYRILTDQVGSVRMVVNVTDSTDTPFSAVYTAFGEATAAAAIPDFIPFGFAGGMFDIDTGLVRFGARDYDPTVGRWISKDLILFDGDGPNLYVYVLNDPINHVDLTGEGFVDCGKAIAKYLECKEQGDRSLENRNKERKECGGDDPGHDKAIEQKKNRCEALRQKAFNACKDPSAWGPLLIVGVVGVGASLLTGTGEAAAAGALVAL